MTRERTAAARSPLVRLLDARALGVDEEGLREAARARCQGGRHAARSYRFPYALIAIHNDRVGVDIERVEQHDRSFGESISTPGELRELARAERAGELDAFLSELWCGKEALAKALGDALAYDPRRLDSPLGWPDGRSGRWRAEQLPAPPGHVAWLCWRSAGH